MKLLKEVQKIFKKKYLPFDIPDNKYPNIFKYVEDFPDEKHKYVSKRNDMYFKDKYKNYIVTGYYGFDLNSYMPEGWREIIDDVLELCTKNDPNFRIHQIKMKMGGIRFYVIPELIEDMYEINKFMDSKLYSPYLMF